MFSMRDALIHGGLGALGWGGVGALTGALEAEPGERGQGALLGGLTGGLTGGLMHGMAGGLTGPRKSTWKTRSPFDGGYEPHPHEEWGHTPWDEDMPFGGGRHSSGIGDVAPWMKGVKSKADAKSAFRAQARAQHPDMGGTDRGMQDLNAQWERVQAHPEFSKMSSAQAKGCADAFTRFGVTPWR